MASDKMTTIKCNGSIGIQDYGWLTREEIIISIRKHADYMRNQVAIIDACKDDEFEIWHTRGPWAQNRIKKI